MLAFEDDEAYYGILTQKVDHDVTTGQGTARASVMKRIVRVGRIEDQDRFRRDDMAALTPEARIDCLLRLRQQQFGARAKPIRGSGILTCRVVDPVLEGTH